MAAPTQYYTADLELKAKIVKLLEAIYEELKRSNDSVDELNRLSEETQHDELDSGVTSWTK